MNEMLNRMQFPLRMAGNGSMHSQVTRGRAGPRQWQRGGPIARQRDATCRPPRPGCVPPDGQQAAPWSPRWAGPCFRTVAAALPATAWLPAAPHGCPARGPHRSAWCQGQRGSLQQPAAAVVCHQIQLRVVEHDAEQQSQTTQVARPGPGLRPLGPTAAAARAGGLDAAAAAAAPGARAAGVHGLWVARRLLRWAAAHLGQAAAAAAPAARAGVGVPWGCAAQADARRCWAACQAQERDEEAASPPRRAAGGARPARPRSAGCTARPPPAHCPQNLQGAGITCGRQPRER